MFTVFALAALAASAIAAPAQNNSIEGRPICLKSYNVKKGDTCSGIAAKNGLSLEKFELLNDGRGCGKGLQVGTELCVKPFYDKADSNYIVYCTAAVTVRKGDTCDGIARDSEYPLEGLLEINPLANCGPKLQVGTQICVDAVSIPFVEDRN
jgi:LysM repeat protein